MELLQNTSMKKVQIHLECDQWRNIFYSLKDLNDEYVENGSLVYFAFYRSKRKK